jgi:hypothetical protein
MFEVAYTETATAAPSAQVEGEKAQTERSEDEYTRLVREAWRGVRHVPGFAGQRLRNALLSGL